MPALKGIEQFNQALGRWGFWITSISMLVMGLALGMAGILQTYIERVMGMGYMTAQAQMQFWFKVIIFCGLFFLAGVVMLVYDLLRLRPAEEAEAVAEPALA